MPLAYKFDFSSLYIKIQKLISKEKWGYIFGDGIKLAVHIEAEVLKSAYKSSEQYSLWHCNVSRKESLGYRILGISVSCTFNISDS